jgi:hypothetical protein
MTIHSIQNIVQILFDIIVNSFDTTYSITCKKENEIINEINHVLFE